MGLYLFTNVYEPKYGMDSFNTSRTWECELLKTTDLKVDQVPETWIWEMISGHR